MSAKDHEHVKCSECGLVLDGAPETTEKHMKEHAQRQAAKPKIDTDKPPVCLTCSAADWKKKFPK